MCGRFTLQSPEEKTRAAFNLQSAKQLNLKPRYNITPSQDVAIIRNTENDHELAMAQWGLVPHWSKEPKSKYSTINARIETIADKASNHTHFKTKQCLIPADGFYEWVVIDGKNVIFLSCFT